MGVGKLKGKGHFRLWKAKAQASHTDADLRLEPWPG